MMHLGDITKINGAEVPAVDVITGGSPCQDLSVAGKRAGLDGERSGLFMEQIRIVKEMRKKHEMGSGAAESVRYMVLENVPGAFSSNGGKDFQAVLTEIVRIAEPNAADVPLFGGGKRWPKAGTLMGNGANGQPFSVAYRVHDAQYWGVPQRRKRIALVADFGGLTAPEVLFERKGLPGDSEPGETQRQGTAENAVGCADEAISFQERAGKPGGGKGILIQNDRTGALSTLNNQSVVYGISSYDSNAMKSPNPHSGIYKAETSRTLDLNGGNPGCNQGGIAVVFDGSQVTCPKNSVNPKQGDPCFTLHADSRNLLVEPLLLESNQNHATVQKDGVSTALPASMGEGGGYVPMVCLEGNGARESHKGDGYSESETMYTLNTVEQHAVAVLENHAADSRIKIAKDGVFQTLGARMGTGGNNQPMVMCTSKASYHTVVNTEKAGALVATDYKDPPCVYGLDRAAFNQGANAQYQFAVDEEKIGALVARGPGAVCAAVDCRNGTENPDINGTLQAKENGGISHNCNNVCRTNAIVRRLTPMECERLQGFPDHWTDIGEWVDSQGKKHKDADSPRYKALGNSIALPFWQWMADRICAYYDRPVRMASLFDGIGGFPLVFERAGGKAVWASEIEEFPIAVTKRRFQE